MNKVYESLIGIVGGIIIAFFGCVTLSYLWGWFITPEFHIKVPSYPVLYGLSLIAMFLTHTPIKKDRDIAEILGYGFGKCSILLLFGWITQAIFM